MGTFIDKTFHNAEVGLKYHNGKIYIAPGPEDELDKSIEYISAPFIYSQHTRYYFRGEIVQDYICSHNRSIDLFSKDFLFPMLVKYEEYGHILELIASEKRVANHKAKCLLMSILPVYYHQYVDDVLSWIKESLTVKAI